MRLRSLYRYPVKGLSPEPLNEAALVAGGYFPSDRLYAIENGPSGFNAAKPDHQPKIKYLMLMRNESLARLTTRYDDATRTLSVEHEGTIAARGDLSTADGRAAIEAFFTGYMPDELRGPAKVLAAPDGHRFTDSRRGFVSLINLASVQAIESLVDWGVDPLRFRGNLYIDGMKPWAELDLVDAVLGVGDKVQLKVLKRTERCAATNVDPATGLRDLAIPHALMRAFDHADCGVYAEVLAGGVVRPGDDVRIVDRATTREAPPF